MLKGNRKKLDKNKDGKAIKYRLCYVKKKKEKGKKKCQEKKITMICSN